jgi:N-acyl-D-aspartate/D-glutamate deacylase
MRLTRRQVVGGAAAGSGLLLAGAADAPQVLFREVRLVDGTGAPARLADVLVEGDRIARVGAPGTLRSRYAARVVRGDGRVLAPGFIDLHAHGDPLDDDYQSFLAMGVTTIVLGQDGDGPRIRGDLDLRSWMRAVDAKPVDLNVAALSSHGTLRRAAGVPDSVRRPDAAGLARMAAVLEREQRAGAFGMSYGLEYVPGIYAEAAELNNLGRVVARYGGVVMSHMRSEDDDRVNASIEELIASSQPARAHISHLKVVYGKGEARARALLDYIAAKRRAGIAVTADAYPYAASFTGVSLLFPEWALPPTDYAKVVRERGPELRAYLERRMTRRNGPDALLIGTGQYAGKTVAEAAREAGVAYPDFLMKLGPEGASGAHFIMDQRLVDTIFADPEVAVCTDGGPGMRHPRATGTYARLIQDYVVRDRRLTLETAVHKATGQPARILRLSDRGTIRPGAKADLILFDPARVAARSTYLDPFVQATGFDLVLVNGQVAFADGARQTRAGRLLRASRRASG